MTQLGSGRGVQGQINLGGVCLASGLLPFALVGRPGTSEGLLVFLLVVWGGILWAGTSFELAFFPYLVGGVRA